MKAIVQYFTLMVLLLQGTLQFAQGCECNKTGKINVCYLSREEYCYNQGGCNHSIDGLFMADYLVPKLVNPANFGQGGISNCQINLKKITNLKSTKQINDAKCHIFFVGSFAYDTLKKQVNSDVTSVPKNVLNYIRDWSMQCESNLVYVAQAEAAPWGYKIENQNQNPNTAISDPAQFSIFNGPFGSLNQFLQGGSYQGVITKTPNTGHEILAQDRTGRPTVAFDKLTKDFILGDIGIVCGQAGNLSNGGLIQPFNSNDILAANMFALGCQFSTGNKFTDETVFICQNREYTLPNGRVVNKEQVVADSFIMKNGCDSVHFYKVFLHPQESSNFFKNLCEDDTFKYIFQNDTFDVNNPSGFGKLINRDGCDSLINVRLNYYKHTTNTIKDNPCADFVLNVGLDKYDFLKPKGISKLKNQKGCDSTVFVDLTYIEPDTTELSFIKCAEDTLTFDNNFFTSNGIFTLRYDAINPCDSFVILTIDHFDSAKFQFPKMVKLQQYGTYQFRNSIDENIQEILWDNENLSCINCVNPTFNVNTFPSQFLVKLKDLNNCKYDINIETSFDCISLVPNIMNPLSVNGNDKIQFKNDCPFDNFKVQIYDRWGNIVYQSTDLENTWDGRYNGNLMSPGVYTYSINFNQESGPKKVYGNITIVY